jgi:hypothetical protein
VLRVAAVLVVASGCLRIPSYAGEPDAETQLTTGLRATLTGTGCAFAVGVVPDGCTLSVLTDDLDISFAPTGTRLPQTLSINGGTNLFAAGSTGSLYDGMGFLFDTDAVMQGSSTSVNGSISRDETATLTLEHVGPAYVGVQVDGMLSTASCAGNLTWHLHLAFFPDGRIARHDDVVNDRTTTTCLHAGSYLGVDLDGTEWNQITLSGDGTGTYSSAGLAEVTSPAASYQACVSSSQAIADGPHIAIGFADESGDVQDVRLSNGGDGDALLANDWIDSGSGGVIANDEATADTQYEIDGHSTCNNLAASLVTMPSLGSAGSAELATGMYVASFTPGLTLAAQASLAGGFVIRLMSSPAQVVIEKNGAPLQLGSEYLVQYEDGASIAVIWFAAPLNAGDSLVFSAM